MAGVRSGWLLPAALLLIPGCGGAATVSGVVTWNGQPVARGKITLLPQEEDKGLVVGADIIDGKYKAREVPLGKKRVDIEIIDTEVYLKPLKNEEKSVSAPNLPKQTAGQAPATFRGLAAEVDRQKQTLDFALPEAKPQGP